MFYVLHTLIQTLQPVLTPICFVTAWVVFALLLQTVWRSLRQGIANVNRLHQIPCSECQFFTDDYRLKCTVRPTSALTEDAINCSDFCPRSIPI